VNRLLDVLHLLRSRTYKTQVELAANLVVKLTGNTDASRLGEGFQPSRYIDSVAVQIVALDYHVADVESDSELHLVFRVHLIVTVPYITLELHRRYDRVHRTAELCDHRVSGTAEDSAVVGLDGLIGDGTTGLEIV
jgi:hypothetical protein